MLIKSTSIRENLDIATSFLKDNNIETARLDAEVLLCHAIEKDRTEIYAKPERTMTDDEISKYIKFLERRAGFEPVAYIRGKKEFYSLEFKVNKSVMIPRPETELLVDKAIDFIEKNEGKSDLRILDLGTGSGAISISILLNTDALSFIYMSDLCINALSVAKENVEKYKLKDRAILINTDLFNDIEGLFDLIISNPPYISTSEIDKLNDDVKLYEPKMALDGGKEGFEVIEKIIEDAFEHLNEQGEIFIEIGPNQEDTIKRMKAVKKYSKIDFYRDYSLRKRIAHLSKGG